MTLADEANYRIYSGVPNEAGHYSFRLQLSWVYDDTGPVSFADCLVEVRPAPVIRRLDAPDRYDEATLIAQEVAPSGAALVYLASGEGFADALSAASIAGARRAPLLLSTAAALPTSVVDELVRLAPADIVLVGGENSLQPDLVTALESLPSAPRVHRVGGEDRFAVSANLILHPQFGLPPTTSGQIYLADGTKFPDALSATPTAVMNGVPVLLIDGRMSRLAPEAREVIAALGSDELKMMGGDATIRADLAADLERRYGAIRRFGGADRYDVSRRINQSTFSWAFPRSNVYLATGESFPDALTGGALAGITEEPLFLVPGRCIPYRVAEHIGRLVPDTITLFGGRASLTDDVAALTLCP
ncbi:cell wall-binding repeat-containing protein [Herbiconiux sp. P18]|uniref:cell wall-binding repeat-containing protein n=1 Tax=Herbiconiux liangxiaofengii TaxID=3342795 RepID=UPI0035B7E56F